MGLSQSMLPEFDHEMANTRKTLERVPDEKFDWKPHDKSFPMGKLASHLANLPNWANVTIGMDEFDMAPDGQPVKTPECRSTSEVLETFDKNVTAARAAIAAVSDDTLFAPWSLLSNGNKILSLPRVAVLRSFVMNHIIHHRAQLGVYLRLNDVPVPSIYGPSADENM
ncbi:MAG: damage-inducible protein DinB [Blastocatellia bacterium]|nr:MAG: damage-inducible protein DinB [Blastocatellia bacterium]